MTKRGFSDTGIYRYFRVLGYSWLQFRKDHCLVRASGLAFTSFIALVPFAALIFSLLSMFGAFEPVVGQAEEFLFTVLLPTKQEATFAFISEFLNNAKTVGYVGLFSFVFVAFFLINNIVNNVNAVWGTHYSGRFFRKLSVYPTVLLSIALILGVSVSLLSWVQPFLARITIEEEEILSGIGITILPEIIVFLTLFLLFLFTPYTRVKMKSALVGAATGVVFWEIAKFIFVFVINSVIRMSVIYGSITILPIFMIWLYIAWGVFLFALEITYIHQYGPPRWGGKASLDYPPSDRLKMGLQIFLFIAQMYKEGRKPPDQGIILRRFYHGGEGIPNMLAILSANRMIMQSGGGFIPWKPLDEIPMKDLFRILLGFQKGYSSKLPEEEMDKIVYEFSKAGFERLGNLTADEVLEKSGNLF